MSLKKTCFSVGSVGALLTCVACSVSVLDLGTNTVADGGPSVLSIEGGLTAPPPPPAAGCTDWIDDDIHAAQEAECSGSCTVSKGGERQPFASRKVFIDHTGGPWFTCDGSAPFGPSDTIGVEFAGGCRLFFLKYDSTGALTRGSEIRHQGVYGIFDPALAPDARRIDFKTSDGTRITYEVTLTKCPQTLVLTEVDTLPGRAGARVVLTPARLRDGGSPGTFPR